MWYRSVVVGGALLALVSIAGCDRGDAEPRPDGRSDPSGQPASSNAASSAAAVDTSGNALIKRTVFDVTTDVNKISVASAAEQKRMLPAHLSAVSGMLSRFESKLRSMHVKVEPDWVAVIDSVKADVAKMPDMSTEQLHAFLPEHNQRVMRIVACVDMTGM